MKTIEEIITLFGGVEGLYVSIENRPFMRLVIEHVGGGPNGLPGARGIGRTRRTLPVRSGSSNARHLNPRSAKNKCPSARCFKVPAPAGNLR